jgi:selenide, water dikinase
MSNKNTEQIKLTQYSHGAGCGCKLSPKILEQILHSNLALPDNDKLLVGNNSKDDAAVYNLGNDMALISTTDFFMPIVDDPFEFGRIASANAISDVYAMGGKPILAIAILGWPVNSLPVELANRVIEGSRSICLEAGIPLAGGHSIDSIEPIFGLSVNGIAPVGHIRQNNTAKNGDILLLTKRLGVGILTTAEKKGLLEDKHQHLAANQMMQLNKIGELLGEIKAVHAMTDVTGFGLLGHLLEMAEGSGLGARLNFESIPLITPDLKNYVEAKCIPGGTIRNWDSYGGNIEMDKNLDAFYAKAILADPQTSGGLLIAVSPQGLNEVRELLRANNLYDLPIGRFVPREDKIIFVQN